MIKRHLDDIQLHFIVAKERTGSTLLASLLNEHNNVLSVIEEPFLLYFYRHYKDKILCDPKIIRKFIDDLFWMQEENLGLYFPSKEKAISQLIQLTEAYVKTHKHIDFLTFCKFVYFQFLSKKDKSEITTIIDKQLKYTFHLNEIQLISPKSKFIFLIREPKDNISSCIKWRLGHTNISFQSEIWNVYTNRMLYNNIPITNKILVRYEDLILNTEATVNKILSFLDLPSIHLKYEYSKNFKTLIEHKKHIIGKEYYDNISLFHSGLLSPINKSKIGEWKNNLTGKEQNKIEFLTQKNAIKLGYNFKRKSMPLSITDYTMIIYAKAYRVLLLNFYYFIPLRIKVLIRKLKSKIK